VLRVAHLSPSIATMDCLAQAVAANASLTTLDLASNMIYGAAAGSLSEAIAAHPKLVSLSLDHNPLCDAGGVSIARALLTSPLTDLSLAFTGVGDDTCACLAAALAPPRDGGSISPASPSCQLRRLNLTGDRVTSVGASALAASLGGLRALDLGANTLLDSEAACTLAAALPASSLSSLRLAGCGVDARACARLAMGASISLLTALDLSANHFGAAGSDEIAWVLADCAALTSLSLADCDLDDEAADELLEALPNAAQLSRLDLRWNRLAHKHRRYKV